MSTAKRAAEPRSGEPISKVVTSSGAVRYRTVLDHAMPGEPRRQRRATFNSLSEARNHVAKIKSDRQRGALPKGDATFDEIAGEWLLDRERKGLRPATLRGYRDSLMHARAAFGHLPIERVSRADVERLASEMKARGLSGRTVSMCLGFVRSVLSRALSEGRTIRNVAVGVTGHGGPPGKRVALTVEEGRHVALRAREHRLEAAWLLSLSGLRRSEVLGLKWSDVDLDAGTLHIRRSRVQVGKEEHIGGTKTARGTRSLPLSGDVLEALRSWRATLARDLGLQVVAAEKFLFVDVGGTPIRPEWYSDEWMRLCHLAGIRRRVKLHEARHYSVVAMREAGLPDRLVAAWHGHDEVVMRRTYDHADMDSQGLAEVGRALAEVRGLVADSDPSGRPGAVAQGGNENSTAGAV
jgi:integrase